MTDDTTTKIVMFLIIFWGIVMVATVTFSNIIPISTNADINSLDNNGDTLNFETLWNLMTFQVSGSVYTFVGVILNIISVLTVIVTYKLIFGR